MKALQVFVTASLLFAGTAIAQQAGAAATPGASEEKHEFFISSDGPGPGQFLFVERMDHQVVKGAPYTATATTESTQVLADGNRIVHKQSGLVARDGEGRTRREMTMDRMGPVALQGGKMIFIHDPVGKAAYMLNPDKQTARVMKGDGPPPMPMLQMHKKIQGGMAGDNVFFGPGVEGNQADVKTESLGTQQIEGVTAEGKRVTRTIPAGAIGNEQPIVITVETWTSPDLHTRVLQKRNDPRFGETVFRLTNIKQGEPDATLFQVPGNYKTFQAPRRMHGPMPAPPPAPAQ